MAKKKTTNLYCFGRILNIILAILPTNPILGIITRALKRNWIGVILNIVLMPVMYVIDLITVVLYDKLVFLA